jgi:hypothetical protein
VHLAAARLLEREVHRMPQPLEQANDGAPRSREQRVVEARDEERDVQWDELTGG